MDANKMLMMEIGTYYAVNQHRMTQKQKNTVADAFVVIKDLSERKVTYGDKILALMGFGADNQSREINRQPIWVQQSN